jgi:hypothetical protein
MFSPVIKKIKWRIQTLICFYRIKESVLCHHLEAKLNNSIKIAQAEEIFQKNKFIQIPSQRREKPKSTAIIIKMQME